MTLLSFPDINVWVALAAPEHEHAAIARNWWRGCSGTIAFCRLSQLGVLRLLTTASFMDGKPLSNAQALDVYDRFFEDGRVAFVAELPEADRRFRRMATSTTASPKVWADAWLLAVAQAAGGTVVTFDRALASRSSECLLLKKESS
jgi:toxin-antitoxin system PIN domain toxin